jgi:hypothetical protein
MHHDKKNITEQKWCQQSETAKIKAASPRGKTEEPAIARGPSARDRLPDQQVAIILGFTTAQIAD